ncbi:MAG: tetratricopeptide repeat protein [Flavobacteriales bacterium]|nr:tetratricopeptide repeat protein [Flavobacteriales bacterium]
MSKISGKTWMYILIGGTLVLLVVLSLKGINSNKATFDDSKNEPQIAASGEINIEKLLRRFTGSNEKLNRLVTDILGDTANSEFISTLKNTAIQNRIIVFAAYADYLSGLLKNNDSLLLSSANLFFEGAESDPDSMADRSTYSAYSKRACDYVLKKSPENLEAITRKATCAVYIDGAVMQGVGLLKQAIEIDSNYIDAQHHLMVLSLQSGQYEKAIIRLKKLLSLQPENREYAELLHKLETNTK